MNIKVYIVSVHLEGYYTVEDPRCPSYWKGSGCYDIDIHTWADVEVEVWAETEEQARRFAMEYEYYDSDTCVDIESAQVDKVRFVVDMPGRDKEEAGVIEPIVYNWKEVDHDYPDPDDYKER